MSNQKVYLLWAIAVLSFLLFIATASANTIQLRHEVLTRLQSANLVMQVGATGGCAIWDYADVVIVACYGDDRRRQYKQVMVALADFGPVNKYSALLDSGHVEVRDGQRSPSMGTPRTTVTRGV